jgi:uncharacterized protein (UPF0332 family)
MSFDWSEYLTLAQELTSKATTSPIQEAHFRCAISRAYYAAFCKARNLLLTKDGYSTPRGTNVHWDVVDKFENSSDITRQHIGALIHNLRSVRNIVDYKDTFYGNHLGKAKAVLAEAEEVIRMLGTL